MVIKNALNGLDVIHKNGVVHRDIKPNKTGTMYYMSPSQYDESGIHHDYWTLGVSLIEIFLNRYFMEILVKYYLSTENNSVINWGNT